MVQAQRYAPCRRTALAAWATAVVAPALLGWAFLAATTPSTVAQPPHQVIVTAAPSGTDPHR